MEPMQITSKNKIIMAELVREVLEEMKAKTEEGEVTQRFNKCYLLQRLETSEAEFGRMEPESQKATKVSPLWATRPGLWDSI